MKDTVFSRHLSFRIRKTDFLKHRCTLASFARALCSLMLRLSRQERTVQEERAKNDEDGRSNR